MPKGQIVSWIHHVKSIDINMKVAFPLQIALTLFNNLPFSLLLFNNTNLLSYYALYTYIYSELMDKMN